MFTLVIQAQDSFDEATQQFVIEDEVVLTLEHSLVSLSKWESTWEKPFLGNDSKSTEETIGYIQAMTLTPNVPPEVYRRITQEHVSQINEYISAKMTATWFSELPGRPKSREIITAELIYYWMVALTIPLEWENRHLNRLLTFIRVCNQKNEPKKKMSRQELARRNHELNEARMAQTKSAG